MKYWLALHRAPEIGPVGFQTLLAQFQSPAAVFDASVAELARCRLAPPALEYLKAPDWRAVEQDLTWLEAPGNHLVTLGDARYPARLREIPDPPPIIFVKGDPTLLARPQIAVVGSRNATGPGREIAFEFARALSAVGLVITSGLALGVDGVSHRGALEAGGGTVAVCGCGLDRVYPARHRDLAHRIAAEGALVTEFPLGTAPLAENFPRRNRIISGLSLGVLVVEAARRSGSLITARLAAEQGREVFAIPGSIHNPLARGCHALLREGAKLVESAEDVVEEIGPQLAGLFDEHERVPPPPAGESPGLGAHAFDADYVRLLDGLGYEATPIDVLVERTGLTAEEVSSMLLILELEGHVSASTGGRYCRITQRV